MQTKGWIALFQEWLNDNQFRLKHENVRVEFLGITPYVPSSIHVNFSRNGMKAPFNFGKPEKANFTFWIGKPLTVMLMSALW